MEVYNSVSTGMKGFDKAIDMLRLGDNVVWQINSIKEYKYLVKYYVEQLRLNNSPIIYIKFDEQESVIDNLEGVNVYELNSSVGFEKFTTTIHNIIIQEGEQKFYIFDNITDLQECWYSELMAMNFIRVIFPHLNKFNSVAYFALKRNSHTYDAMAEIRNTTQLLLDIYEVEDELYIYPRKVLNRYSQTMFFPHKIVGDTAIPITSSCQTTDLVSNFKWNSRRLAYWRRTLNKAKSCLKEDLEKQENMKALLIDILAGKETKIHDMCMKYFDLSDLIKIAYREIGTGFIGGKSLGMLLATTIISKSEENKELFNNLLEPHDSFFIGADIFYSYIVENGMWELRIKQKNDDGYFKYSQELKEKLSTGNFSKWIKEQFMHMLEYYGQSPIIVRSSSLLEDSFGNAFAGKYESVFCVNQGTPEERLEAFENAVKTVYASTMNQDALSYRKHRGLDKRDEQMAILVQRVSGDYYGDYFYPHIAGVGNSSNLYVWNKKIDMSAGMLRLVFGLGTRAVDRVHSDYARIVTLDDPMRMPLINSEDEQKYSQHDVDLLNLKTNQLSTVYINEAIKNDINTSLNIFGVKDYATERMLKEMGRDTSKAPFILNFKGLLKNTKFPKVMKIVLSTLSKEYEYPVDIEFTANFNEGGNFRFNIVQCRPLQTRGLGKTVEVPKFLDKNSCIFSSSGNFMGGNVRLAIDYIVFISAKDYMKLNNTEKYSIARQVGLVNTALKNKNSMLMGPGRWGTSTPSLGVPVHFTELCNMSVMCEIAYSDEGLMPELSYGSHFFQDLVETGIFYVALFDNKSDVVFNEDKLNEGNNIVNQIVINKRINEDVIKVYDTRGLEVYSDITSQIVTCSYNLN
ncbi:MAG: PEP/pyruvate-binding domain-containing protein [Romboutsia sp.]|uniref:PEP/pyruvate-binding domain-containing protein n=1 Tax=Romboutsia sp. TaxID=1965302 RepID=UPI003F311F73